MSPEVRIEFDQFGWERLTEEAERQGVSLERLVNHAVMYYLGDLDSGRPAARVVEFQDAESDKSR